MFGTALAIYMYAKQKGLIVTLFTNGTLIDENTALLLKKLPPFSVEITLYGATKETYESLTGVNGLFFNFSNICLYLSCLFFLISKSDISKPIFLDKL